MALIAQSRVPADLVRLNVEHAAEHTFPNQSFRLNEGKLEEIVMCADERRTGVVEHSLYLPSLVE